MASSWGTSWGTSWASSWGATAAGLSAHLAGTGALSGIPAGVITRSISVSFLGIGGMDAYNPVDLNRKILADMAGTSRFTSRILDLTPPIVIPKPGSGQPSIHPGSHPVRGQSVPVRGQAIRVPGRSDRI